MPRELYKLALDRNRLVRLSLLMALLAAIVQIQPEAVNASVQQILLQWVARLGVLFTFLLTIEVFLEQKFGRLVSGFRLIILSTICALLPFTMVEVYLETLLPQPQMFDDTQFENACVRFASEYLTLTSVVLPLHCLLWFLLNRLALQPSESPVEKASESIESPFLQKLEGIVLPEIVALQADEHYVRVFAKEKEELIYYKFGDAVAELSESTGVQVHRPWWVARQHIVRRIKEGRQTKLQMSNDMLVPVSRTGASLL